jgi:phage protein D
MAKGPTTIPLEHTVRVQTETGLFGKLQRCSYTQLNKDGEVVRRWAYDWRQVMNKTGMTRQNARCADLKPRNVDKKADNERKATKEQAKKEAKAAKKTAKVTAADAAENAQDVADAITETAPNVTVPVVDLPGLPALSPTATAVAAGLAGVVLAAVVLR